MQQHVYEYATKIEIAGVVRLWRDDTTRTVTTWDAAGVLTDTRPYTAAENAAADAEAVARTVTVNEATIRGRAATALTANNTFLALTSPTNAQVLAQTKILTRECSALIRLALRLLDTTTGT